MKRIAIAVTVAVAGGWFSPATAADDTFQLIQEKQCLQCHSIDKAGPGPSFHSIALHWKGHKNPLKPMMLTIRKGSDGTGGPHWNKAKMPDQSERPLVSQAEASQMAKWILKQ